MQKYKLKYGKRDLELQESKKLIGVRPKPGMSKAMEAAIQGLHVKKTSAGDSSLGGFEIVEVEPETQDAGDLLDQLRSDNTVNVGTHVFHTSEDDVPFVPTGELFVVFKENATDAAKQKLLDNQNLELVEARDGNEFIVRISRQSRNPLKVAADLQESDIVEVAEPELATVGRLTAAALPTDALLNEQWHLRNTGHHRGTSLFFKAGADARVIDAWQTAGGLGSPGTVVGVIDDGFDLTHPDLNGSGKVVHPFDFTRNSNDPSPGFGDWHGTACAGVAVGNAGGGEIVGAAPNVTLMPVRWGRNLADREIENWFGHVTRNGADVVSCSWGAAANVFELSTRAHRAIEKCAKNGRGGKGCVVVFAAGNDDHDINDFPRTLDGFAIHPDVIAVAACNSRDKKSHYSNFGAEIWIAAPSSGAGGAGVLTADVTGHVMDNGQRIELGYAAGDYTFEFGGTSSACPLVAGICALILTENPDLTSRQVRKILRDTARRIGADSEYDQGGHSRLFGYGCINADAAVARARQLKEEGDFGGK